MILEYLPGRRGEHLRLVGRDWQNWHCKGSIRDGIDLLHLRLLSVFAFYLQLLNVLTSFNSNVY